MFNATVEIKNRALKKRIIEISYKKGLSHLGSCLTAVDIIEEIWRNKSNHDTFVLSSGHAGLALYVVLEKYEGRNAEEIFEHHGVHPDRCSPCGIEVSSGSLGQGLPIAVGMALADRSHAVYCLISDGETAEGSIYEALNLIDRYAITNIHVFCNANGYGGYRAISKKEVLRLPDFVQIYFTERSEFPFLQGQDAHYHVMNEQENRQAMEILA